MTLINIQKKPFLEYSVSLHGQGQIIYLVKYFRNLQPTKKNTKKFSCIFCWNVKFTCKSHVGEWKKSITGADYLYALHLRFNEACKLNFCLWATTTIAETLKIIFIFIFIFYFYFIFILFLFLFYFYFYFFWPCNNKILKTMSNWALKPSQTTKFNSHAKFLNQAGPICQHRAT